MPLSVKRLFFLSLVLALLFAFSLAIDRALALFGIETERPEVLFPVAPPHYETRVDTIEYAYDLRTNSRGLRSREIPISKAEGRLRIVLLGDSYTEGLGVADEDRWGDVLERRLRVEAGLPVDVVNCAETGRGPMDYLQALAVLCLDYEPDLVLVSLHPNDTSGIPPDRDAAQELDARTRIRRAGLAGLLHSVWPRIYTLLRSAIRSYEYRLLSPQEDILERVRAEAARRKIPEDRLKIWLENMPDRVVRAIEDGRLSPVGLKDALTRPGKLAEEIDLRGASVRGRVRSVVSALDRIRSLADSADANTVVALMPTPYQVIPGGRGRLEGELRNTLGIPVNPAWAVRETEFEKTFSHWAEEGGVPLWNLTPYFRALPQKTLLYYPIDAHWTPRGHQAAAEFLYPRVRSVLGPDPRRKSVAPSN